MDTMEDESEASYDERTAKTGIEECDKPVRHDVAPTKRYSKSDHKGHDEIAFQVEEEKWIMGFVFKITDACHMLLHHLAEHGMEKTEHDKRSEDHKQDSPPGHVGRPYVSRDTDDQDVYSGDHPDDSGD